MNKKRIALIGCGRIGFLLENDPKRYKPCTHYGGLVSTGLKYDSACDINKQNLEKFAKIAGIDKKNTFTNHLDLLNTDTPYMITIATWTDSHVSICIDAISCGVKIIILEKPIAPDLKQAKKLIDLCKKKNVHLIINHERRYDSRYIKTKKIIQDGKIGEIKTVYATILTKGYYGKSGTGEGGGPLLHDGTHLIDIIRFFFGEISTVEGEFQRSSRKKGYEDRAIAWLKTENGIDIFIEAGGERDYFHFELIISGIRGKIIIGNGYEKLYLNKTSKFYTGFKDLLNTAYPKYTKNNCFQNLYNEAKHLYLGKKNTTVSTGLDGYRALEIIHSIYLSSYLNRKKINLPINENSVNLKKIFGLGNS